MKKTRKLLVSSLIMILSFCLLFAGTTFAWFSDSVTSGNNIITAGNLDVELEYSKDGSSWFGVDETTKLFKTDTLWEPGHVEAVVLKVTNDGTLALKYSLSLDTIETASINVAGEELLLSKYLVLASKVTMDEEVTAVKDRASALKFAAENKNQDKFETVFNGTLVPGKSNYIQLVIAMPESVENEANYKKGVAAPQIEFTVNLFATQVNSEEDSFGNDYDDASAVFTVAKANEMLAENKDVLLVNCNEPNSVIYIPANYTSTLTLSNVKVASIQESNAPTTISSEENNSIANIMILGNVVVKATEEGMSAITGKNINISGTGTLTAVAKGLHAYGIGGDNTESINIKDVTIANVEGGYAYGVGSDTKYYKDAPEGGAAIGSGFNGATITLNNVTVIKAIGGSKSAAIGALYHVGVNVNINDSEIKYAEGGVSAAAIGGSRVSSDATENGTTINIKNSTINAVGGAYGAGIGSGYDTHCQATQPLCTINIADSKVTAQGGKYAAGVGTGYHNAALSGEITNSDVNATPGEAFYKDSYTMAMGVGFGVVDPAREGQQTDSSIKYNGVEITLNDAPYGTSSNDSLNSAIESGKDTIILTEGTFIIPDSAQGKTLHIIGSGEDTVIATQDDGSYEGCDYSLDGATVTFENITINTDSSTYTGYARLKATYINCTINGTYTLYGDSTFENCTFNVSGDAYNIWTWGASKATFEDCTFNTSGKSILLYGNTNTELTVTNCVFNDANDYSDVNNKAAIEVGSDWTTDTKTIIATNCTVNGFDITTKGINTETTLWGNKNSLSQERLHVVINGVESY